MKQQREATALRTENSPKWTGKDDETRYITPRPLRACGDRLVFFKREPARAGSKI